MDAAQLSTLLISSRAHCNKLDNDVLHELFSPGASLQRRSIPSTVPTPESRPGQTTSDLPVPSANAPATPPATSLTRHPPSTHARAHAVGPQPLEAQRSRANTGSLVFIASIRIHSGRNSSLFRRSPVWPVMAVSTAKDPRDPLWSLSFRPRCSHCSPTDAFVRAGHWSLAAAMINRSSRPRPVNLETPDPPAIALVARPPRGTRTWTV